MLEDDVKTSKASSNHHYSEESMGQELTKGDISNLRMCPKINQSEAEITISKLKVYYLHKIISFFQFNHIYWRLSYINLSLLDFIESPVNYSP